MYAEKRVNFGKNCKNRRVLGARLQIPAFYSKLLVQTFLARVSSD